MNLIRRIALCACACSGLALNAPAEVTGNVAVSAGDDAVTVVGKLAAAWNSGNFACLQVGATLQVTAVAGPCTGQQVNVTVDVNNGGTLNSNHTINLEVDCNSPLSSAVSWDGNAFLNLSNGVTQTLTGGMDRVDVSAVLPVPAMPRWGLVLTGLSVLLGGAYLIGRGRLRAATHG